MPPHVALAHDDVGAGPAVVLLHSGVADRRMWRSIQPALSSGFRVIAPDLRGFGQSPLPGGEFCDADDVAALLDVLGVPDAAVVGSSLGGRVALELATGYPDRVSSLVLLCPAYRGAARTEAAVAFSEQEAGLLEAGQLDQLVDLNVRTWLGPDATEETRAFLATMHRHAIDVQLAAEARVAAPRRRTVDVVPAEIVVPTVVVTGGLDLDHFQAVARLLVEEIPEATLVSLPWAGHLPSLERTDETAELLLGCLGRQPGPQSS